MLWNSGRGFAGPTVVVRNGGKAGCPRGCAAGSGKRGGVRLAVATLPLRGSTLDLTLTVPCSIAHSGFAALTPVGPVAA